MQRDTRGSSNVIEYSVRTKSSCYTCLSLAVFVLILSYYFTCLCIFPAWISMHHVPVSHAGQMRALCPLEQELKMVVGHRRCWQRNWTWVLWKSVLCSKCWAIAPAPSVSHCALEICWRWIRKERRGTPGSFVMLNRAITLCYLWAVWYALYP